MAISSALRRGIRAVRHFRKGLKNPTPFMGSKTGSAASRAGNKKRTYYEGARRGLGAKWKFKRNYFFEDAPKLGNAPRNLSYDRGRRTGASVRRGARRGAPYAGGGAAGLALGAWARRRRKKR